MNLEMMKLLARLLKSEREQKEREYDAAGCLVLAFSTVLLCALSGNAVFPVSVIAAELLRLSVRKPETIAHVLGNVLLATAAAAVFMLPAVFFGSPGSFGIVTMKVLESVLVLTMLNEDVSWKKMTAAMRRFHMPGVFVLTLDMTVRFLYLLGSFSNSVLEAVTLRRVGDPNWKNAGTGGILGNTFLKAQEMSQGTGEAMLCRCFDGTCEASGDGNLFSGQREQSGKFTGSAAWMGRWAFLLILAAEILWFAVTEMWMRAS